MAHDSPDRNYRVVSRDFKGDIQRIWGNYSESHAEQLAADLRKENWSHEFKVEPAPAKMFDAR